MQVEALTCPRCGAPLPPPRYGAASCAYCGVPLAAGAHGAPPIAPAWTRAAETRRSMLVPFEQALAHAMQGGASPLDALRAAAAQHLGPFGESEAIANVALALASENETRTGAELRQPTALARLVIAYLDAIERLATERTVRIALPFLGATPRGPVDGVVELDVDRVRVLAARAPTPPKRGFFAKLFG